MAKKYQGIMYQNDFFRDVIFGKNLKKNLSSGIFKINWRFWSEPVPQAEAQRGPKWRQGFQNDARGVYNRQSLPFRLPLGTLLQVMAPACSLCGPFWWLFCILLNHLCFHLPIFGLPFASVGGFVACLAPKTGPKCGHRGKGGKTIAAASGPLTLSPVLVCKKHLPALLRRKFAPILLRPLLFCPKALLVALGQLFGSRPRRV